MNRQLTPALARRLAITRQRLAGQPARPTKRGINSVMRDLGSLQLDPISVVARSPLLVRTRVKRLSSPSGSAFIRRLAAWVKKNEAKEDGTAVAKDSLTGAMIKQQTSS